jgi:hypothetical protein
VAIWVWILIVATVVAAVAVIAMLTARGRGRAALQRRFGPEYDRTARAAGDWRAAEADLRAREEQRASLDIRPLPRPARLRYAGEWQQVQERFVDHPPDAVAAGDDLVQRVMEARGYPVGDFEARANLVSVDHPDVVPDYRLAHAVCEQARAGQVSTEALRAALLRYRSLFDGLLQADRTGAGPAGQTPTAAAGQATDRRQ